MTQHKVRINEQALYKGDLDVPLQEKQGIGACRARDSRYHHHRLVLRRAGDAIDKSRGSYNFV